MYSIARFTLSMATMFSFLSNSAQTKSVTEYMSVPGPITFDKKAYELSWSSHPSAAYYKQEYLVKGDNPDRFRTMLMLEVLTGKTKVGDAVSDKVNELKSMKTKNPFVSYQLVNGANPGEQILDFVLTENSPDGKSILIAEHNVYHYLPFKDPTGTNGIQLFAFSERVYDAGGKAFINGLKTTKTILIGKVKEYPVPKVALKN